MPAFGDILKQSLIEGYSYIRDYADQFQENYLFVSFNLNRIIKADKGYVIYSREHWQKEMELGSVWPSVTPSPVSIS